MKSEKNTIESKLLEIEEELSEIEKITEDRKNNLLDRNDQGVHSDILQALQSIRSALLWDKYIKTPNTSSELNQGEKK